jgi:glyoxylase-like metal-dependent hydrolase (beta-lactamase superfamily II)
VESIPIAQHEVVPMDRVAIGLKGLQILFVNVFGVDAGGGEWVMIDAGLPHSAGYIRSWVRAQYGGHAPLAIILTHGHFDHVGACRELADQWHAPVYAHQLEHPYLNGHSHYAPPDPSVGGGLMARLSPLYPKGPFDMGEHLRALPQDGTVPHLGGWRWLHTPGHTEGHISLFRAEDSTLLVGDAFCTTKAESFLKAMSQPPELSGPPAYFTTDWDAARASVRKLASLRPQTLAPGHGRSMHGAEVAEKLELLAHDFDRIAMPKHGKYADESKRENPAA